VLTPDDDKYMDGPMGSAGFVPYLCRVYPVEDNEGKR